jgi:hypothetical protein
MGLILNVKMGLYILGFLYRVRFNRQRRRKGNIMLQSEENDNLNKVIHDIETELVKIYDQKAKVAQIRCGEKWVEYGEKNNSYLITGKIFIRIFCSIQFFIIRFNSTQFIFHCFHLLICLLTF